MGESSSIILIIGLLAQLCFALRQIFQWWASENAKSIQSPISFWVFSLFGAIFFLIYGVLRLDFAIVLGQFLNFYVYCRNLYFKGIWTRILLPFRVVILFIPFSIMIYLYLYHFETFRTVFINKDIGSGWFLIGTVGYLLFTLRFIYQWFVSERFGTSKLPVGFFVISIVGSIMIISYGFYRLDIILIFGYLGGILVYVRNLVIHYQNPDEVS